MSVFDNPIVQRIVEAYESFLNIEEEAEKKVGAPKLALLSQAEHSSSEPSSGGKIMAHLELDLQIATEATQLCPSEAEFQNFGLKKALPRLGRI